MTTLITAVEGNRQRLDGGAMFGNAPRAVWEKWIAPDERGRIPLACRALLIEHRDKRILCETGVGAFFEPKLAERFGIETPTEHRLLQNLNALDLSESDIDFVILSHLHFDHAGGLLSAFESGRPYHLLFPRARYVVGQKAWDRALHPHPRDRASFVPELQQLLIESGRLMLVEGDHHPGLLPERLRFIESNGHTPGQLLTVFRGDAQTVFFAGDLIPGRHWVHLPITMGYDRYPELLIDEKTQLYQRAVPEKWLVFFTHDPEISACQIEAVEKSRFQSGVTFASLQRHPI